MMAKMKMGEREFRIVARPESIVRDAHATSSQGAIQLKNACKRNAPGPGAMLQSSFARGPSSSSRISPPPSARMALTVSGESDSTAILVNE